MHKKRIFLLVYISLQILMLISCAVTQLVEKIDADENIILSIKKNKNTEPIIVDLLKPSYSIFQYDPVKNIHHGMSRQFDGFLFKGPIKPGSYAIIGYMEDTFRNGNIESSAFFIDKSEWIRFSITPGRKVIQVMNYRPYYEGIAFGRKNHIEELPVGAEDIEQAKAALKKEYPDTSWLNVEWITWRKGE